MVGARLFGVVPLFVKFKEFAGVAAAVSFGEGNDKVHERPDAKSEPAEKEFADADADLAAHEAVHAKAAKEKGKGPDKEVLVDAVIANEIFGIEGRSSFGDKIAFAIFVNFDFVANFWIFKFNCRNWNGDDSVIVFADFYLIVCDF